MHPDTLSPRLETLVTGHFFEGPGYRTWRARGTHDDLLIYTVAGRGRFGYPGGFHLSKPGELLLLRSDTPHDYATEQVTGHWELLWTHFRPRAHWEGWLDWPQLAPGLLHFSLESEQRLRAERTLLEMHRQATGASPHREQWGMNALERVWLECLPPEFEPGFDERVARAVRYIRGQLSEGFRLSALAEHCHLSESRISHLFREHTGQSPLGFLERERFDRAAQLLRLTSRRVSSIALEVGYEDPLHFSRRFRAAMGVSPRQYRDGVRELTVAAIPRKSLE